MAATTRPLTQDELRRIAFVLGQLEEILTASLPPSKRPKPALDVVKGQGRGSRKPKAKLESV